jgi:hypothetical protein
MLRRCNTRGRPIALELRDSSASTFRRRCCRLCAPIEEPRGVTWGPLYRQVRRGLGQGCRRAFGFDDRAVSNSGATPARSLEPPALARKLAVADGALGFCQAIEEVWAKNRGQLDKFHRRGNREVGQGDPGGQHQGSKNDLPPSAACTVNIADGSMLSKKGLRDGPDDDSWLLHGMIRP